MQVCLCTMAKLSIPFVMHQECVLVNAPRLLMSSAFQLVLPSMLGLNFALCMQGSSSNTACRRPSHRAQSAFAAVHTPRHALATSASAPDLASASLKQCGSLRLSMDGNTARLGPVDHQPGVVKESHLTVRVSAGAGILLNSPQTPTRKHESS